MLARTIYVNKSSVTRQLALLEQNGYIYRTPSEKDKRVMQVFPTQKAYDILPKVKCMLEEWEAYITSGFTDEEKSFMLSLLERMMEKAAERVERESDI
jgi:DNA-binding MarR family transcriptional regulator